MKMPTRILTVPAVERLMERLEKQMARQEVGRAVTVAEKSTAGDDDDKHFDPFGPDDDKDSAVAGRAMRERQRRLCRRRCDYFVMVTRSVPTPRRQMRHPPAPTPVLPLPLPAASPVPRPRRSTRVTTGVTTISISTN